MTLPNKTTPTAGDSKPLDRVIRPNEAAKILGISLSKFYQIVAEGVLPRPFAIIPGGRAKGLWLSEINSYLNQRAATRDVVPNVA